MFLRLILCMSIERSCWRNRKELLWSGYYPKWYGDRSAIQTAAGEEVVPAIEPVAIDIPPEEQLILPALFILVRQEKEHEQLV